MTAEEYVVQELLNTKAEKDKAERKVTRLKEEFAQANSDLMFLIGLFTFHNSYAHAYISKVDPEDFDRLKVICGFEEGGEEDG